MRTVHVRERLVGAPCGRVTHGRGGTVPATLMLRAAAHSGAVACNRRSVPRRCGLRACQTFHTFRALWCLQPRAIWRADCAHCPCCRRAASLSPAPWMRSRRAPGALQRCSLPPSAVLARVHTALCEKLQQTRLRRVLAVPYPCLVRWCVRAPMHLRLSKPFYVHSDSLEREAGLAVRVCCRGLLGATRCTHTRTRCARAACHRGMCLPPWHALCCTALHTHCALPARRTALADSARLIRCKHWPDSAAMAAPHAAQPWRTQLHRGELCWPPIHQPVHAQWPMGSA